MSLKPKSTKTAAKKKSAAKRKAKPIPGVTPTGKIKLTTEGITYVRDYKFIRGRHENPDELEPVVVKDYGGFSKGSHIGVASGGGIGIVSDGVAGKVIKTGHERWQDLYEMKRVTFAVPTPDGNLDTLSWTIDRKGNMRIDTVNKKKIESTDRITIDQYRLGISWANTWGAGIVKKVIAPQVKGITQGVSNYDAWEQAHVQREREAEGW